MSLSLPDSGIVPYDMEVSHSIVKKFLNNAYLDCSSPMGSHLETLRKRAQTP